MLQQFLCALHALVLHHKLVDVVFPDNLYCLRIAVFFRLGRIYSGVILLVDLVEIYCQVTVHICLFQWLADFSDKISKLIIIYS